jgi:hypothetical protein
MIIDNSEHKQYQVAIAWCLPEECYAYPTATMIADHKMMFFV